MPKRFACLQSVDKPGKTIQIAIVLQISDKEKMFLTFDPRLSASATTPSSGTMAKTAALVKSNLHPGVLVSVQNNSSYTKT